MSLNPTTLSLTASSPIGTISVTRAGDGEITATSSNTDIAIVNIEGTIITVTAIGEGSATITVSVSSGTNYNAPASKTVNVNVIMVPALNDATWAQIREVSQNNQGENCWSVGDRKAVKISGTVGSLSVNSTFYVYILGFNHNNTREGNGIHFGGFKTTLTGGADICLVDDRYSEATIQSEDGDKLFNMNHAYQITNSGGWKGCDLRYDILGSTKTKGADAASDTATNPVPNTLIAAFPSDLRSVMQPMTKYTDNTGGSSSAASYVTKTIDYLPLLAEFEIIGKAGRANSAEQNYQTQYEYFSSGNAKIKKQHSDTSSNGYWWERSRDKDNGGQFCFIFSNTGASGVAGSTFSYGLSPIFKV